MGAVDRNTQGVELETTMVKCMYEFLVLDPATAPSYESLTFPYCRVDLSALASHEPTLAVGVHYQSQPVGLILAKYSQNNSRAKIYYLFIGFGNYGRVNRL